MTREEAMAIALDWAEGRKSYTNEFMLVEADPENRAQTLNLIAQADCAEVVKWTAIAASLPESTPMTIDEFVTVRESVEEIHPFLNRLFFGPDEEHDPGIGLPELEWVRAQYRNKSSLIRQYAEERDVLIGNIKRQTEMIRDLRRSLGKIAAEASGHHG